MPYVVISTQIRVENGPTFVGDEESDSRLMAILDAKKLVALGNDFYEYKSPYCPRMVMNKLELEGYKVVGMAGIGQTCVWTLYKELDS